MKLRLAIETAGISFWSDADNDSKGPQPVIGRKLKDLKREGAGPTALDCLAGHDSREGVLAEDPRPRAVVGVWGPFARKMLTSPLR
jgi:hypothetical protein